MPTKYKLNKYVKDSIATLDHTQRRVFLWLSFLRTVVFGIDVSAILLLTSGVTRFSSKDGDMAGQMVAAAATAMLLRSVFTFLISRYTFRFLSQVEVIAGGQFTEFVFSAPQEKLDSYRTQDLAFALNQGTNSLTSRTLGFLMIVLSDGAALVALVLVFAVVYPLEGALMIFLVLVFVVPVQLFVNRRVHQSAAAWSTATIEMLQQIQEFQNSRKEIYLNSAERVMSNRLGKYRSNAAQSSARFNFMLTVPRTVIEVATLVVAGILLALAFVRMSSSEFVVFSAMLMAVVFRVAPLAIGLAGAMGVITQSIGETTINRKLLKDLSVSRLSQTASTSMNDLDMIGPAIELSNVSYSFPGAIFPVLENVDLEVLPNEVCAVIGASGSGKSTLLDCLMGLRDISAGSVRIFGREPNEVRRSHPGTMGLVIQSPSIRSGSIAENVAFFTAEKIDRELVSTLLFRVGLKSFLVEQPNGIDTLIGDGHLQMSGGEKQRLALARALYRNPRILIMDEPTSALDGLSESQVFELIEKEKLYRTVVLVTHRQPPSLIFDRIYEVRDGKVFSRPAETK